MRTEELTAGAPQHHAVSLPVFRGLTGGVGQVSSSVAQAHAALLVAFAVMTAGPLLTSPDVSTSGLVARWGVVATFAVTAVWMLRRGESFGQLLLVLATLTLAAPALVGEHIPGETVAGMLIASAVLLGARVFVPWVAVLNALIAWAPFAIATVVGIGQVSDAVGVADYALASAMAMAAVGFVNALETLSRQAEQTSAFTARRRTELMRTEAHAAAVGQAQRVLHDDVLGTLAFIAGGQVRDVGTARSYCRRTAASITRILGTTALADETPSGAPRRDGRTTASYGDLLARIVELAPVTVAVEAGPDDVAAIGGLPQPRADALERAVMEALRNVSKHSGRSSATVTVRSDRHRVQVVVRDDGVGIASDAPPGFGLAQSIRGAMLAAGGEARIVSAPDQGTSLTLNLPRGRLTTGRIEQTYADTVAGFGVLPLATRSVALPMIFVWTLIGGYQALIAPSPIPNLAVVAGWTVCSLAVLQRVEHRAPTRLWVLAIGATACLLQVSGLALMEAGAMLDYRSWSIGFSAAPMVLLVFVLPVRAGLLLLASQVSIVLAAAWAAPSLSGGQFPFGAVNAPVTAPMAALLLGMLVRRTNHKAARRTSAGTALEHALLMESARVETAKLYFEYSRDRVRPWLDAIGRGQVDPTTVSARDHARLLAFAARDDLFAPGFIDEALRDDVARFREDGGVVELRAGLAPGGSGRSSGRLLGTLLTFTTGHRIIVAPATEQESRVRISIVPAPPDEHLARLRELLGDQLDADVDEFRAVLLVEDLPISG